MNRTSLVLAAAMMLLTAACSSPAKEKEKSSPADAGKAEVKKPQSPYAGLVPTEIGKHAQAALHVAYSADGSLLLSTGKDRLIKLWDVAQGKLLREFKGHTDDVMMADFSPDGRLLVSASKDQTVRVWEVASGKQRKLFKDRPPKKMTEEEELAFARQPPPLMNWAAFSPDGKSVITASDNFSLKLWDLASGKAKVVFRDDGCRQRRVYRRQDAPGWVSSAGCMDDGVSYLKFWDEAGNLVNQQGDENHDAHFLAFDGANRFIVTADGSVSFSVYSGQGSYLKRIMVGAYHFCVAFGFQDKTLLVGADNGYVYVYRPVSWQRVGKLDVGSRAAVDCLAVHPTNGTVALALRDGKILTYSTPIE